MPEQATATTLDRPRTAPTGERQSVAERVWQITDVAVNARLHEAHRQIVEREGSLSPEGVARLAYANQVRFMEEADIDEMTTADLTANQIALVMLESPFAARAHSDQQTNPARNPHDRAKRVGALAQFNHDLAAALSYMSPNMMGEFPQQLLERTQRIYGNLKLSTFDQNNFNQIVSGISREVAFSRALHATMPEEWKLRHATVREDLNGIDVVVETPEGTINVDTKTANAFAKALDALWADHRISQAEYDAALNDGFVQITTTDGREVREVYILNADSLGKVKDFEYDSPDATLEFIEDRLAEQREQPLRNLGKNAINR